ncbi:MAG: hypothetical protein LUG13_05170 [Oscillospiraceae bacterium]|nr:hypothetical protein [Oscillospiraceae bacterium]
MDHLITLRISQRRILGSLFTTIGALVTFFVAVDIYRNDLRKAAEACASKTSSTSKKN